MKKATIPQYTIASILVLVFLIPVLYIIFSSFKPINELFSTNPTFFPNQWTTNNYIEALRGGNFGRYIFNSFIVAVSSTVLAVVINSMSGYALAKFRFKGDSVIMLIILSTIMLPLEIIMVVNYSASCNTYGYLFNETIFTYNTR